MATIDRKQKGSIFILTVLITFFVIMPLLMVLSHIGVYLIDRDRTQSIVEAAGLLAANDLSRLVIDDTNFGYVSLSNYPATGEATKAKDGEPLPVTGINTLLGTLRQNAILARELKNPTMSALVDADRARLEKTIQQLNGILSDNLSGNSGGNFCDINGANVDCLQDVTDYLTSHLPNNIELESVKLTNGWLSSGGTTTIPVPLPLRLAFVDGQDMVGENYKAFVDLPVANRPYNFAGLGQSSSLVMSQDFQEGDGDHICSIVKIECIFKLKNLPFMPFGINAFSQLRCVACCQPFSLPDSATKGVMVLRLSNGPVSGLQCWRDFLKKDNFRDNKITTYDVVGGDFPVDQEARMSEVPNQQNLNSQAQPCTSQQFAEHLYFWLRSGHLRPRLSSVLDLINEPFQSSSGQVITYEFADSGKITRKLTGNGELPVGVISESQVSSVADTNIPSGLAPIIVFRDNVKHLGTKYGGKHAGQPLPFYRQNWCDTQKVATLEQAQPKLERRTLYGRGLALDIEIGSTREPVEEIDIETMKQLRQRRQLGPS